MRRATAGRLTSAWLSSHRQRGSASSERPADTKQAMGSNGQPLTARDASLREHRRWPRGRRRTSQVTTLPAGHQCSATTTPLQKLATWSATASVHRRKTAIGYRLSLPGHAYRSTVHGPASRSSYLPDDAPDARPVSPHPAPPPGVTAPARSASSSRNGPTAVRRSASDARRSPARRRCPRNDRRYVPR